MNKPYSPACDNNREPILAVLEPLLSGSTSVLEIGSGTGQHAVYFGRCLPHLDWHTSDVPEHHPGIRLWLDEAGLDNVHDPLPLDVSGGDWPQLPVDAVFSANTAHIMSWPEVQDLFTGVGRLLPAGGLFILYGPFNFRGQYTSESNRSFDQGLRGRDPDSGIRDTGDLDELARDAGLELQDIHAMPANNHILVWEKTAAGR